MSPHPYDYAVLEVSSFQLETIEQFHPWIAAVLNVTLDHMDRYASVDDYVAAKAHIFSNQVAGDYSLFNLDDVRVANLRGRTKATVLGFSRTGSLHSRRLRRHIFRRRQDHDDCQGITRRDLSSERHALDRTPQR